MPNRFWQEIYSSSLNRDAHWVRTSLAVLYIGLAVAIAFKKNFRRSGNQLPSERVQCDYGNLFCPAYC